MVEDDEGLRTHIADFLRSEGWRVSTAEHGGEALRVLDGRSVDLIVLDLMMPVVHGWEFRRLQLQSHPRVPVVLMTAGYNIARIAAELEVAGFVQKPFDLHVFMGALHAALGDSEG